MGWWIRTRDSVLFRLCQIYIYIYKHGLCGFLLAQLQFYVHLWIPKWVRMSSGEAYYSPLWDDYLTQPSVILGLGDNIMYCVLSRLPKSCVNFLFLGPGNFWDTDKKEKGMILEETIPRIFLLTPSLDVVWGEGAGGFPFPFGEAPVAPFNQVPWWVHTLLTPWSSHPLPPTLLAPSPFLSSPTCKVN